MRHWKQNIHRLITKRTPAQLILIFYIVAVTISAIILQFPIFLKEDVQLPTIDALFVSVSALSVTGLTTVSIGDTFNTAGIIVIAIILHLGAVGLMTFSTLIWLALGKKIGLEERRLIMTDQNQTSSGGMVYLVKEIVYVLFLVESIGVLILSVHFTKYFDTQLEAFYHGFFGTISAISNAGFSIANDSLMQFHTDYFVQSVYMILIIFGAIGFPVLIEVKAFLHRLFSKGQKRFRFSLFTKLTSITFFSLILFGSLFIYLVDRTNFFAGKAWHEQLFYALFQSVTTRSSGLSTMDISLFSEANQLFLSLLMFIGASPSSAGGGIRTTTFALVIIFILTYVRGGKSLRVFNREIYDEDLFKAVTVLIIAVTSVFVGTFLMLMVEPFTLNEILFEVTSAFGTVGLSLGITGELSIMSKLILMILMFIGRIGVVTFLISFRYRSSSNNYHYPKERVIIG